MAKILTWLKPDLTIRNRYGGIPIIPASERGHPEYVRWVTANTPINVNHVNDLGWTALLEAVILGGRQPTLRRPGHGVVEGWRQPRPGRQGWRHRSGARAPQGPDSHSPGDRGCVAVQLP